MIEPIMFIGIGFLVAGLLVIGVIPLVHARAVRLTMRRLEAVTPMSMAEIQADKDQLRAEFAMSTRRLEMSVEQMKAKTTSQLAEIGKKSEAIGRLKLELGEKTAALFALEAKEKQLTEELQNAAERARRARPRALQADRAASSPRRAAELAQAHRQAQRQHGDRRQPARRAGRAARAGRGAQGPDRELREGDQGACSERLDAQDRRSSRPRTGSSPRSATKTEMLGSRIGELERSWWRRPPKPRSSAAASRS